MGGNESKKSISFEVKVTDRCNLRCFHCVNNDGSNFGRDLDECQFAEKLTQWAEGQEKSFYKIREIRMTGGEPLVSLRAVLGLARTCLKFGIKTGINTNATLLDEGAAHQLKEAGIEIVKASFDAVDETAFRQIRGSGTSLGRNIAGIRTAVKNGFRVILRLTLCSYNRGQLLDCYRMARDLGVEKLQIKPLVRSGRAIGSNAFLNLADVRQAFCELASVVKGHVALPEVLCWPPEQAAGLSAKLCSSLNKIYFSVNCDASVCNYLPWTGAIGNLKQETLESIINRRRFEVYQTINGHFILPDCPQSEHFNALV